MGKLNIALDGPSGSGKSATAKAVAKKLGIIHLDTGAMFRAIALKAINSKVSVEDEDAVQHMLESTNVDVKYIDGEMKIYLDGVEVSKEIRANDVSKVASDISALKCVRDRLLQLQRKIATTNNVILDGRDIGTVVLPNANYKFFLTADSLTRAKRRKLELETKGENVPLEVLVEQIETRDYNDSHREIAPLKQAQDAVLIDTTKFTLEQVVQKIIDIIGG